MMSDPTEAMLPQANSLLQNMLRAELEATRLDFHALLARLTDEDWNRPSHNPSWTIGEVLWHIVSYLFVIPEQLVWLQSNAFPDPFTQSMDELNNANVQQTREEAQGHTVSSLAQTYDTGHAIVLAALNSVRNHEWQLGVQMPNMGPTFTNEYRTIEGLFRYHVRHFAEHAAQIPTSNDAL